MPELEFHMRYMSALHTVNGFINGGVFKIIAKLRIIRLPACRLGHFLLRQHESHGTSLAARQSA